MKILHLTIKKKWYDMIASGEKKEEYREDKEYWRKRLIDNWEDIVDNGGCGFPDHKKYDIVEFRNGYGRNAPTIRIECIGIDFGKANPNWSEGFKNQVFIIKLGKILS